MRLVDIRKRWEVTNPLMAKKLYGVDSIGFEEQFDIFDHLDLFLKASDNGFKVFYHIGEQWSPGTLQEKLHQMNNLLKNIQISYITNPVALLIDSATLDRGLYPKEANHCIQSLQIEILEKLINASTVLEISPTSNDILSRQLRQFEAWKFLPLHEILEKGPTFVIGDDNGGIFETNYLEEFRKLYFGETSLGRLDIPFLKRFVLNSEKIYNSINSDLYQEEPKNEVL
jgi:adenosine deaminase